MIGDTLAHYEITAPLGRGGMGEVYRARDTKLGRDVAIKVLPVEMSGDPERLARFEREARTLATLQHANIASIYGFEKDKDTRFLVMELVEGDDLSVRLERGAMPVDEVTELALQLADGLAAAHAVGITHRDLKPANLKITPEGKLKILDFGLARAYAEEQGSSYDLEHSPTITEAMTQAGVILGTAAYMSPEQARGKRVDHRADIWSYGVVVMEMLTGTRLFDGETVSDTLAGVLRAELPWGEVPANTPPTLRRLLQRCLERDPSRRLQSIAEARIALEDLKTGRSDETRPQSAPAQTSGRGRERLAWGAVVVVLVAALAATTFLRGGAPAEQPLTLSTLLPPEGWDFSPGSPFAVSADGRQVAFVALSRPENEDVATGSYGVWIRDLAEPEPRFLAETGGEGYPFWSPDGRWIGFFTRGNLNKVEARGGPVIPLCDTNEGRGGTWNADGTIVFQRAWSEALMKIPAGGGTPQPLTTLEADRFEVAHRWPQFLPDGRRFLFYVVSTTNTVASEYSGVYLGSLDSDEKRFLLKSESRGLYAQGHLVYRSGSTLMARPFDVDAAEFTGDPVPVATDIPGGAISWGGAYFGVSEGGVLVHMRGEGATNSVLNWRERDGTVAEAAAAMDGYWEPSLSSDGTRVAVAVGRDAADIWIYDLERDTRTRFTFDPADDRSPIWSPDDSEIAFASSRQAQGELWVRPTSGQEDARLLYSTEMNIVISSWSPDGRWIFFARLDLGENGWDLWAYDMENGEAKPLVASPFSQYGGQLSPDGRWLAFTSDESGAEEVYVQTFPEPTGRWMVSNGGGNEATWRSDGREIFYLNGGAVLSVPLAGGTNLSPGTPTRLFSVAVKATTGNSYAITKDGSRFLVNELPPVDPSKVGARLIQNWVTAAER